MGYEFNFTHNITRGPLCIDLEVTCEYTPATESCGSFVEFILFEAEEADVFALGSLWIPTRKWIEKNCRIELEEAGKVEAHKQGMDKYDEAEASRFDGFSRRAVGYGR